MKKIFMALMILFLLGISYPPVSNAGPVTETTIAVTWTIPDSKSFDCDGGQSDDYGYSLACISVDIDDLDKDCVEATRLIHLKV